MTATASLSAPLLGSSFRTVGLVINAPAVFARKDFMDWLRDPKRSTFTWHPRRRKTPGEYSDTVVLVDSNYDGDCSDMPEDIWVAICDSAYAEYGGPDLPLAGNATVHVRLTNLHE